MNNAPLHSAIYSGWVEHTRYRPNDHHFAYQVFMVYLDLDELDQVFSLSRWWSKTNCFVPAFFKRSDYLGDATKDLKAEVCDFVSRESGTQFSGKVCVLTNLRYFGYITNPISCYYCFSQDGRLEYLVAEVTNTPWGETTHYLIKASTDSSQTHAHFQKTMHVSPFNHMNMSYLWNSNVPDKKLFLNLVAREQDDSVMSATVLLKREEISTELLNKKLIQYPLMTVKVISAIYWEALRLWLKKTPLFSHPKNTDALNSALKGKPYENIDA